MLSGDKSSSLTYCHPLKAFYYSWKCLAVTLQSEKCHPFISFTPTGSRLLEMNFSFPLKWNYFHLNSGGISMKLKFIHSFTRE
jgi:hypothetical protein